MRLKGTLFVLLLALLVPAASAGPSGPYLGVYGDGAQFASRQAHPVRHVLVGWEQGQTWGSPLSSLLAGMRPVPMLGFSTSKGWPNPVEAITSQGIAAGKGDSYLFALNGAINAYGSLMYVRPLGEMDGAWNLYCAFNANGSPRSPAHSTAWFRKAFARMYLILHGGTANQINLRLRRLGLPPVSQDLPANPPSKLRVIWNPLGWANPDVPGNQPAQYYPGDAYVDVVGGDVYKTPTNAGHLTALEELYAKHPNKPFAIPEWGLDRVDDPDFVRRVAQFIRTHGRTEVVVFYNAGSSYSMSGKPRTSAAYRSLIVPLGRPAG